MAKNKQYLALIVSSNSRDYLAPLASNGQIPKRLSQSMADESPTAFGHGNVIVVAKEIIGGAVEPRCRFLLDCRNGPSHAASREQTWRWRRRWRRADV